jgi:hypothetical protein
VTNADIPRVLEAFGRHLRGEPVPVVALSAPPTFSESLRSAGLDTIETVTTQATATLFTWDGTVLGRGPIRHDSGTYHAVIAVQRTGTARRLCIYDSEGHLTIGMTVGRFGADVDMPNDNVAAGDTVDININFWSTSV